MNQFGCEESITLGLLLTRIKGEPELQRQMQKPWTGLCEDSLSDHGGTGRLD